MVFWIVLCYCLEKVRGYGWGKIVIMLVLMKKKKDNEVISCLILGIKMNILGSLW